MQAHIAIPHLRKPQPFDKVHDLYNSEGIVRERGGASQGRASGINVSRLRVRTRPAHSEHREPRPEDHLVPLSHMCPNVGPHLSPKA